MKIDKDIPVPDVRISGRPGKYPWLKMEVGDSFLEEKIRYASVYRAARIASKNGRKFRAKEVEGGVRVWRVE